VEASEEVDLGGVAEAAGVWVEAGVKLETHHRAVSGEVGDGDASNLAALDAADLCVGHPGGAGYIGLRQASGESSLPQIGSQFCLEPAPSDGCFEGRTDAVGHDRKSAQGPLPHALGSLTHSVGNSKDRRSAGVARVSSWLSRAYSVGGSQVERR
jgi:hypothetical protein